MNKLIKESRELITQKVKEPIIYQFGINYQFDVNDAVKYGLHEAVFLKYWKNSDKRLQDIFPFWSYRQIRRIINKLKKKGIISINYDPEKIKQKVISKNGNLVCEWCNNKSYSLQDHHYPIPKKNGGKDTVKICGTCHSDYHSIQKNYEV